jgi:hypothetical protein
MRQSFFHQADLPPSSGITAPLIKELFDVNRNWIIPEISLYLINLFMGFFLASFF